MSTPRLPFSDGLNSFAHVTLGLLSVTQPVITKAFFLYQAMTLIPDDDTMVDIGEFIFGHIIALNLR